MHAFPDEYFALKVYRTLKHYRNVAKCDLNTTKQNKQCE